MNSVIYDIFKRIDSKKSWLELRKNMCKWIPFEIIFDEIIKHWSLCLDSYQVLTQYIKDNFKFRHFVNIMVKDI